MLHLLRSVTRLITRGISSIGRVHYQTSLPYSSCLALRLRYNRFSSASDVASYVRTTGPPADVYAFWERVTTFSRILYRYLSFHIHCQRTSDRLWRLFMTGDFSRAKHSDESRDYVLDPALLWVSILPGALERMRMCNPEFGNLTLFVYEL